MRQYLLSLLVVLSVTKPLVAQIELSPFLIGSGGGFVVVGDMDISFSIGEPVIKTVSAQGVDFTQGFQQPDLDSLNPDTFTVSAITEPACIGHSNGSAQILVSGGKPPYAYVWKNFTGYDLDHKNDLDTGSYIVAVSDSIGNTMTIPFRITSTDNCLNIYTGVSPNGDGNNDYWHIENIEFYSDNKVEIYSRWGNTVWETKGYNNSDNFWRGFGQNDQRLPDGTYFFIIKNAGTKTYKGWIELTGEVK